MKEKEIIELLIQKNEEGMNALLNNYGPLIKYIISPILHDKQDIEDCFSEVLMRVWNNVSYYDAKRGSWNAYLTAIARNTALNFLRKTSRHSNAEEIEENTPSSEPSPEERIILKERTKAVERALQKLSSKERALFYRKYYYLQSTAQIARELGMTERAVEGKLYRLKKQLRKILGGEGYE